MKICLIGDGSSIHLRRWAAWLKARGHIVQMVSITPRAEHPEYSEVVEIPHKIGRFGYSRAILPIRKAVRKLKPDIVHGMSLTEGGFYAAMSGAKHVMVFAWGSDIYVDSKDFLKRQCIKYAIGHSEVTLGESDDILNEVKKLAPRARVEKVVFGIDTELFTPQPIKHDKFTFLSVRATGGVYNPLMIVQAFEKADLDAILMMQEPMADGVHVRGYVQSRPELEKKIVWYSRRVYSEMPKLYNSVDVGISIPSSDSTSQAMLECMSCGVPVIASYLPVNEEWIERFLGNGMLTRLTVEDMADRMGECQDYALKAMGRAARETVIRKADFQTEMLKAESIYKEVLE